MPILLTQWAEGRHHGAQTHKSSQAKHEFCFLSSMPRSHCAAQGFSQMHNLPPRPPSPGFPTARIAVLCQRVPSSGFYISVFEKESRGKGIKRRIIFQDTSELSVIQISLPINKVLSEHSHHQTFCTVSGHLSVMTAGFIVDTGTAGYATFKVVTLG